MKKYMLFLCLSTLLLNSTVRAEYEETRAASDKTDKQDQIIFDSFFISFVDGTQYINIGEILDFARHTLAIINGAPLKTVKRLQKEYQLVLPNPFDSKISDNDKVGLIWFQGAYRTLKWLRDYEKHNPATPEIKEALRQACNHFAQFSADYIVEIETAKGIMVKIIGEWSTLRHKPHSLLLDWSEVDGAERDALFQTMTSVEIFDMFLCDLLLFLKDLVHNCPKSYQKYQEHMKQQNNGPKRTH